jgi:hypothetical protein
MADYKDQRAAVKYCFLLRKLAAETLVMLKTAYGKAALSKTRVYEITRLKMMKCQLKTNPVQAALQHQKLTKMSTKSMPSFVKTVAEPLLNSVRCLECLGDQFRGFYMNTHNLF